jgi:ribosomal protein L11
MSSPAVRDAARPPARATRRAGRALTAVIAGLALVLSPLTATGALAAEADQIDVVAPAEASLTGSFVVGSAVTAQTGAWTPADAALTYVWWQNTTPYQAPVEGVDQNAGATVVTGAEAAQLTLTADLAGRYVWTVVTGTSGDLAPASIVASSPTVVTLPEIADAPGVQITGTPVVNGLLTAALDGAQPADTIVAYAWHRNGAPIDGAVAATYAPVAADAAASLTVQVTFSRAGHLPAVRTSAPVVVAKATIAHGPTAVLSGAVRVDSIVTAVPGGWPEGTTFTYRWELIDAKGAVTVSAKTTSTYTPISTLLGKKLRVVITGTLPGHDPKPVQSSAVTIAAGTFTTAPTPKISGSAYVGATLKATAGTWSPTATLTYVWKRSGVTISGATASSYKLTSTDYGKKITVTVTAKRSAYTTATRTSAATATVTKPFTNVSTPKITGTAKAGSVLTASAGAWSPTPTVSYQWKRNGVAVAGKTSKTYTLTSADVRAKITVSVTYKRTGYFTRTVTSAATASVAAATTMTRNGWYTVGTHVAPGTYYASGGNDCYYERRTDTFLAEAAGLLGYQYNWQWNFGGQKIITIKATDKYFYTEGCGTWKPLAVALRTSVGDGTYGIGSQMKTGVWQLVGPFDSDGCYVELLRSFTGNPEVDVIAGGFIEVADAYRIDSTIKGFTTDGCGTWKYVGP